MGQIGRPAASKRPVTRDHSSTSFRHFLVMPRDIRQSPRHTLYWDPRAGRPTIGPTEWQRLLRWECTQTHAPKHPPLDTRPQTPAVAGRLA